MIDILFYLPIVVVEVVTPSLLPVAPCTILSTPIISRLIANRTVNNTIPDTGCASTTNDIGYGYYTYNNKTYPRPS